MVTPLQERRLVVDGYRFPVPGVPLELVWNNGKSEGRVRDASLLGLGLEARDLPKDAEVDVTLFPPKDKEIARRGTVKWIKDNRCGIQLEQPLHDNALRSMVLGTRPTTSHEYALAQEDYREVWTQIRSIQLCRSNIFIGSLAAIGAATMATGYILATVLPGEPTDLVVSAWLLFGSLVGGLLLITGILSTVEKARAINIRKGFLAALSEYLRAGSPPPEYRGWAYLQHTQQGCGHRRDNGICTILERRKQQQEKARSQGSPNTAAQGTQELVYPQTCWTIGLWETKALSRNKKLRLLPGMFDSFMSLTGFIYCFAYAFMACISLVSLSFLLTGGWQSNLDLVRTSSLVGVALGALLSLYEARSRQHKKFLDQGPLSDATERHVFIARVIAGLAAVGLVVSVFAGAIAEWGATVVILVSGLSGLLVAWLGTSLIRQLEKARRGLFSFMAMFLAWRRCLLMCHHEPVFRPRVDLDKDIAQAAR